MSEREESFDCDVLVAGLGPVGLLLALLLARQGASVIAIDKAADVFPEPRAAVIDDEVLRIFQSAGVAEEVLADSQVQEEVSFVTHGGRPVVVLRPVDGVQGHPPLVSINQPAIERTLLAALERQPTATVRWSTRLESFEQDADGVSALVRATGGADGEPEGAPERIRARWMAGCDGGSSWVRQLLGIEFGGSTFRQRWLVVDVNLDRPLSDYPHPHFFGDWRRPIVSVPMSLGKHRWEWMIHPDEDDAPFLEPEAIRERVEGWLDGQQAEIERAVVYTFHARRADRWRSGRVLLAGDAAHLTPPFAGQGFSSGARDAANLAWKLQAVLDGAPGSLLDTYEIERRPHVKAMTRLALGLGKFVQTTNRRVAAIRDAYLALMDVTGAAEWLQSRIKPVPAYGDGAFAERPHAVAPLRGVGSQFPQPLVVPAAGAAANGSGPDAVLLDQLAGPGWCAIALDAAAAEPLAAAGLRVLVVDRDFTDPEGLAAGWLEGKGARWALLRPDRFVFALGSEIADCAPALDALHRRLGRAAGGEREGVAGDAAAAASNSTAVAEDSEGVVAA